MQGRDRGEGQAAQWVADSTQRDGEKKKSKKLEGRNMPRTPQGMPARAPPVPDELSGFGVATHLPPFPGLWQTVEQTLSGMLGHHRVHQSHRHKQEPQVSSLAHNNWLDNKHRQKNPETPQACEVITCPVSWAEYFCRT